MNCGPRSILHLLSSTSTLWSEEKHSLFRKAVAQHTTTLVELGELVWPDLEPISEWFDKVSKTGIMVDHIWLAACAKYLDQDIVLIMSQPKSERIDDRNCFCSKYDLFCIFKMFLVKLIYFNVI